MIELARPAFLWAGILLAGIPALLHLIRPVERARKRLATSRFLTPDPKRRVSFRRRPDELLLLLVRMLLCFVLGAGFAGIRWVGAESGVGTLVVVDGGRNMAGTSWDQALETAVPGGSAALETVVIRPTLDGPPEVVRLGPGVPDAEAWSALAPADDASEVRLAHLLRALHDAAARVTGADTLRTRIVTRPSWSAWGPGVRELRDSLWPGSIELVIPSAEVGAREQGGTDTDRAAGADNAPPPAAADRLGSVILQADSTLRPRIGRALELIGISADTTGGPPPTVVLRVGPPDALGPLWRIGPDTPPAELDADAFLLLDGRVVPGAGTAPAGTPAAGAMVPLLRAGGRPAAAARTSGGGCEIAIPLDPSAPIVASGDFALVLEAALREGCDFLPEPAGASEAWQALLTGGGRPQSVAVADVRGKGAGLPLARWLLGLALLLAAAETMLGRKIERDRGRATPA
ncbi:MAG: BatA domain-containing protein [Thioalkalivibrio sp.]|nr:BatA domain-containing protein [Thioalkalivibrio sp.]